MKKYFLEGKLASQPQRHHYHTSHPKEQDIVSSLQHLIGKEGCEVRMLNVRPFHGWEGEKTRTEPSIKNIAVLLNLNLLSWKIKCFNCFFHGLFRVSSSDPTIIWTTLSWFESFPIAVIGWYSVSPPQLSTDAPILKIFHPSKPSIFFFLRNDD